MCLTAMYGLNDAPLAWQLVLSSYFKDERKGIHSAFDECFFFWPDRPGEIKALGTNHVDDNGMATGSGWLKKD